MPVAVTGRLRRAGSPRALRARPQLVAEAAAAGAWALLLAHPLAIAAGVHTHHGETLASWAAMSAAMMLPAALPAARHVGDNSLRWRRHRAVALYVAAFLGVWVAYGAVVLAAPRPPFAAALAVAALWQATPWQRRFLRDCHRTVPLPPTGWAATRGSLRFGARNAVACVGTCWALMLAMAAVPGAHLAWTAALAVVVFATKTGLRPRRTSARVGYALAAAAALAVPAGGALAPLGVLLVVGAAAAPDGLPRPRRRLAPAG